MECREHRFLVSLLVVISPHDVLGYACRINAVVLEYYTYAASIVVKLVIAHVTAVIEHLPLGCIVESHQ